MRKSIEESESNVGRERVASAGRRASNCRPSPAAAKSDRTFVFSAVAATSGDV